jgi:hypothetical protein
MKFKFLLITLLLAAISRAAFADDATAFALVKRGDKYVGVQSQDKVVQIRSEKSIGSLTPNIWYVVYYDPDATFKSVQVKFGAGEKMDVSHPWRILEMADDAHTILDPDELKIDSGKAIKIATAQPLLEHLTLKATKLTLGHSDDGPVWRVEIWAAKLKNPADDASVGVVTLSAKDGKIIKADLHPNSVD